ncbi:IgaA/UmoB family intracellular growth attenuator [Xenorhabdus hominickii]|uniref:Intracellular growth attenuator protein igaA n=1 Tax=Xenorhabdus hominickii TaxID=351679 RepID=A0A2G0QF36_XENHO|nr:IgaA/UmoB family intracellular growth attenuator [Xenorhabdus hominickii]AOM41848.1 Intracellular growth attenuator protein igaA [Xenorhabdus hominickii]PHM57818.1 Intracellular growth attenuator protein igaA [Xenorhabdus hominickii]
MSSSVIILAIFIISLIIMASFLIFRWRRLDNARYLPSMTKIARRKLNSDEYQTIEFYLKDVYPLMKRSGRYWSGYPVLPIKNGNVYIINNTITRFSAAIDESSNWHYYVDETEMHLPALFEPFIKQQNTIEIVQTTLMPLVIALNGHSLKDYPQGLSAKRIMAKTGQASIQKNGNSSANLLNLRKETLEEHRLRHSTGLQEGILMCIGLSLWLIALFLPIPILSWLIPASFLFILGSFWSHFRLPPDRKLENIHCFSGIPKRWGVFSEFEPEQRKNISLGGIDLIYPTHWEPYVTHDLDQNTDIDMYTNCHVVRQGRYLSLHEEEKHYPYQRYRKNLILVVFSVIAMLLLYFYQPVSLSMRLGFAWLHGSNTKVITSVNELRNMSLKEGDVLKVKGIGMCYVPPNAIPEENITIFSAFNCIGIYWNSETPLPMMESDIVEHAAALITTVNEQLHPIDSSRKINPSLNEAIVKSGMTLLNNFSQIILKTHKLCRDDAGCDRLKSALVNLSNAKGWNELLKDAESGKLDGTKVLLRSVSADALEKLVDVTTTSFIQREVIKVTTVINSPSPGGVLLLSDEDRALVEYPLRTINIYDNTALDQWRELQRTPDMLMRTPFETRGIVTALSEDANGTLRIMLHSEPVSTTLIRYLVSCLLLAILLVTFILNIIILIKKRYKNQRRLQHITQYYDSCFG